jgi:hypothetical protein
MYYLIKQEQEQLSWFITLIENLCLLQPSVNRVAEVSVQLNNSIEVIEVESTSVGENKYGTLHPDYIPRPDMWLKTRDYYRRPRENFNGDVPVKYYWKWFSDNAPQFFYMTSMVSS